MKFNLNLYKESIAQLTAMNSGVNNYKQSPLCTQKERLIRDLISKGILTVRK